MPREGSRYLYAMPRDAPQCKKSSRTKELPVEAWIKSHKNIWYKGFLSVRSENDVIPNVSSSWLN